MVRPHDAAFAEFVAARSSALHRSAYLMVGDRQLAQDLVQEALTRTYLAWPRLRDPSKAEAYTRKAITTTAISWFRRRAWRNELVSVSGSPHFADSKPVFAGSAEATDDVAEREWLWQELLQLPPRQRAALVLRFYEDLTEAQTAEAMGCAIGTVKSQVSAGLGKLRRRLGPNSNLLPLDPMAVTP